MKRMSVTLLMTAVIAVSAFFVVPTAAEAGRGRGYYQPRGGYHQYYRPNYRHGYGHGPYRGYYYPPYRGWYGPSRGYYHRGGVGVQVGPLGVYVD